MRRATQARVKLVLAVVGLSLFFVGVKRDDQVVRWAGISLVAVAFLLRFAPQREDDPAKDESPSDATPPGAS
jgi:hypothetical protein